MKTIALILPLIALAACSQEPAAAPTPTATPAPPPPSPALKAPDQATFTAIFAETCPEAAKVNMAVCKRAAFGSDEVVCEYGLGDDAYLRNKATLAPADGKWALQNAEAVCKADLNRPAA